MSGMTAPRSERDDCEQHTIKNTGAPWSRGGVVPLFLPERDTGRDVEAGSVRRLVQVLVLWGTLSVMFVVTNSGGLGALRMVPGSG